VCKPYSPAWLTHVVKAVGAAVAITLAAPVSAQSGPYVRLPGHFPASVYRARVVGRLQPQDPIALAIALPLHHERELQSLLGRLYDPADPGYGHFLTSEEFTSRFSPSPEDYRAVKALAEASGLRVTAEHANRLVLDVEGPAAAVESAFRLHLLRYQDPGGRTFRAPDAEPSVPKALAGVISGVIGLDNAAIWQTHNRPMADASASVSPLQVGSGPGGALTPSDIRSAYNLSTVTEKGTGQTLALFELDGYAASDIHTYESYFGLPAVPLQNVLVDGYSGAAGSGAGEVTLDIELMIAVAPGASKIVVYEGPNSGSGVVDTYNRIASDNAAKEISTSWGLAEGSTGAATRNAENTAFQQMAAQGQSIYAASGDSGAYDNGSSLSVDDPASQPYMVGVGGTRLTTSGAGGAWSSETTWNGGSTSKSGGGGGISTVWSMPSWQSGVVSSASKGSTTMRNVPDVSLDADPYSGYSVYFGSWQIYGGTSCAAPLWAAYTALVNQRRAANGTSPLGFANPAIYQVGKGGRYTTDFHDIADGSTNLYYPAVTGYDDATGWGTFNGANLLADLAPYPASQLLLNPGFENGSTNPGPWYVTPGVVDNSTTLPALSGVWKAKLNGYGTQHVDAIYQDVAIPSTASSATLTFWLHIISADTTGVLHDKLSIQVRNSASAILATLATYSNLNQNAGYAQQTFDVSAYKGQTIRVCAIGNEDSSLATWFLMDDFALTVR
jgi:kumamolisin